MVAEDALIKYTRDEGGGSDWTPALHPREGVPPNPGWFAPTGGPQHGSSERTPSHRETGLRFAENQDGPSRSDAMPTTDDRIKPVPGNPMDEPANFADRFGTEDRRGASDFWSKVWPAFRNWLEEPVPEHDLESGEVVGERPRWKAIAFQSRLQGFSALRHMRQRGPAKPAPTSVASPPRPTCTTDYLRCSRQHFLGGGTDEVASARMVP